MTGCFPKVNTVFIFYAADKKQGKQNAEANFTTF